MNAITSGDYKQYTFQRRLKSSGEIITEPAETMTFNLYCPKNGSILITKMLGNGIEFDEESATYTITLDASDTLNLSGRFNFSIRVTTLQYAQTIKRGHIVINTQSGKGVCRG